MTKRSWRNFDYLLLIALLLLSAYGVIMIYSATINTMGLNNPVQRQIVYVLVGTAILAIPLRWTTGYWRSCSIQSPFSLLSYWRS